MESAIADIIDNSITAEATIIKILSPPDKGHPLLYICDNGDGMNLDELDNAMTFGGRDTIEERDKKDLGRYGLGLKTASLSQCRSLSVVTKKRNGGILGGCWNLDYIKQTNLWNYIVLSESECKKIFSITQLDGFDSGTVVVWEKFDRLQAATKDLMREFNQQLSNSQDHLELVFHRYLSGESGLKKLTITVNGRQLVPNDPFLIKKIPEVAQSITIPLFEEQIVIHPHKLLHPSKLTTEELQRLQVKGTLLSTQGFYIYRNKRLLIWGNWFGLAHKLDKTKLCRIQIDIPNSLDQLWALDIKKSAAIPPECIREQLRNILSNISDISIRTFKKKVKKNKNILPYWMRTELPEGSCRYEVNQDNPLINTFKSSLSDDQRNVFSAVLVNLATFFPVSQLQVDFQSESGVMNEYEAEYIDDNSIINLYKEFLSLGLSKTSIEKMQPICDHLDLINSIF
jgi:hypothetical protein